MKRAVILLAGLLLVSCAGMNVSTERPERATPGAQYSMSTQP